MNERTDFIILSFMEKCYSVGGKSNGCKYKQRSKQNRKDGLANFKENLRALIISKYKIFPRKQEG